MKFSTIQSVGAKGFTGVLAPLASSTFGWPIGILEILGNAPLTSVLAYC